MNSDADHIDLTDVMTPVEKEESATLGVIEMLRRRRVCFYPGPRSLVEPGGITDFLPCLPWLGDCDALILCAPHHGKEAAQTRVHQCVYSGDFDHLFDRHECVGTEHGDDWVRNEKLLFPNQSENLLVMRPEPGVVPQATKPPDQQFWAYFVVLSLIGRSSKLHLLYLGLQGDHAWPYFLAPHRIQVARIIADQ